MSLRFLSQQPPGIMSNAISSSHESNKSCRICHLRAVPLGHVADVYSWHRRNQDDRLKTSVPIFQTALVHSSVNYTNGDINRIMIRRKTLTVHEQ